MARTQYGNMKDMMQDVVFHAINGWMSHVVTHAAHIAATGLEAHMKLTFMKIWKFAVPGREKTGAGLITSIRRTAGRGMKGLEIAEEAARLGTSFPLILKELHLIIWKPMRQGDAAKAAAPSATNFIYLQILPCLCTCLQAGILYSRQVLLYM